MEWKYSVGSYFIIPRGGDGHFFVFPPPFVLETLFSSRNGWFLWTPLALLGIAGLVLGALRRVRVFLPWVVVLVIEIALVGSMLTWHGGEAFGSRYMISAAPLTALGVVSTLYVSRGLARAMVVVVVVVCCAFTTLFAVQFRLNLIPRDQRLTASELFTDKLHLTAVRQRKLAVERARALLQEGSPGAAVAILEQANARGEDRDVIEALSSAYRADSRETDAEKAAAKWNRLRQSELW
jgi:hypothetical protein